MTLRPVVPLDLDKTVKILRNGHIGTGGKVLEVSGFFGLFRGELIESEFGKFDVLTPCRAVDRNGFTGTLSVDPQIEHKLGIIGFMDF